ncbi:hypothetical protein SAMN04487792_0275 [Lactobacillus bombicola]|uniref:Uncharacterized protein n=1 Tax=Lactobacillus bombicola TaxID=1505723 RepID=A0A1I1RGF7_9LACO|nr:MULTISPECIES: hypothetical protein [Lactobacillus]MCO6528770.1 hypothetical protein [Lactobacillus sp.]SFD31258.1 hypothetical protein SAMN04487792_0275 [Lactobacillus bombicola]
MKNYYYHRERPLKNKNGIVKTNFQFYPKRLLLLISIMAIIGGIILWAK